MKLFGQDRQYSMETSEMSGLFGEWKLHPHGDIISNYTSLPFIVAIFFTTCLKVVLQLSGYSVFHSGDTPI